VPHQPTSALPKAGPGRKLRGDNPSAQQYRAHDRGREQYGRDREAAGFRAEILQDLERAGVGFSGYLKIVPGLKFTGRRERFIPEYPVVTKARMREVGIEESLQGGHAAIVLPVDERSGTGREADIVTAVHH
jgi:hypothetical protein